MLRPLSSLSLPKDTLNLLAKNHFLYVEDIQNFPDAASKIVDIELIKKLIEPPPSISAFDFWELELKCNKVTTFSKELNKILVGGFRCGQITEICGYQGSGKTQICFQISVAVQLGKENGGLDARSLYIDTRNGFSPQRLLDMIRGCQRIHPNLRLNEEKMMEGVSVVSLATAEDLLSTLKKLSIYLRSDCRIRMIIIDSLSIPVVCSVSEPSVRTKFYISIINELQTLATDHNIAIVVVSELSTQIDSKGEICVGSTTGNVVAHRVQQRLMLARLRNGRFAAKLLKSVLKPKLIVPFHITPGGIRDQ